MGARGELDELWGQRDQAEPVEDCSRAPQDASAPETPCCTHRLHADQLTRDLSEADLRHLDARARALGISRSEYIRRRLRQEAGSRKLTLSDLHRFADAHADLADP